MNFYAVDGLFKGENILVFVVGIVIALVLGLKEGTIKGINKTSIISIVIYNVVELILSFVSLPATIYTILVNVATIFFGSVVGFLIAMIVVKIKK